MLDLNQADRVHSLVGMLVMMSMHGNLLKNGLQNLLGLAVSLN